MEADVSGEFLKISTTPKQIPPHPIIEKPAVEFVATSTPRTKLSSNSTFEEPGLGVSAKTPVIPQNEIVPNISVIPKVHREPSTRGRGRGAKTGPKKKIYICPPCRRRDDGSPMIGCDECDRWFHWICVGIQVQPPEHTDWFCNDCVSRQQNQEKETKRKYKRKQKS